MGDKKDRTITRYEKIGDHIYPVTTLDNGTVIVDYPELPIRPIKEFTEKDKNVLVDLAEKMREIMKDKKIILNGKEY